MSLQFSPQSIPIVPEAPAILTSWLAVFRPCFTAPVWSHILVLVAGTVLAPGKRTVTQALRVIGLAAHRLRSLPRGAQPGAPGRPRRGAQAADASPRGALAQRRVVIAIDDTIERRWGGKSRPGASIVTRFGRPMGSL